MMLPPYLRDRPFTWEQVKDSGMTRHRLEQLLATREVVQLLRGLFQCADLPDDHGARARSAFMVVKPHIVACDRTAAWVYEIDTFKPGELEGFPPIETCAPPGKSRVRRQGLNGVRRDLTPEDIVTLHELAITSKARTAADLACKLSRREALAALDAFMRQGLQRRELELLAARFAGRRGVVQFRELLALADGRAESPGESWTRLCIVDEGFPTPIVQYWVREAGRNVHRLDLAYPKFRVAVEYDGAEFHGEQQRAHDEARREWLRKRGWTIIVVTKDMLTGAAVLSWTIVLRMALRDAGYRGAM